LAAILLILSRT